MPKTEATATTTITQAVTIKPVLKVKLRKALRAWAELHAKQKAAKAESDAALAKVEELRGQVGEDKFAFEGFKIARVGGDQKFFDAKEFVLLGGDLETYNNSFKHKPKKAHTRVTAPGEKEE